MVEISLCTYIEKMGTQTHARLGLRKLILDRDLEQKRYMLVCTGAQRSLVCRKYKSKDLNRHIPMLGSTFNMTWREKK